MAVVESIQRWLPIMVNIRRSWLSSLALALFAQQGLSLVFEDADAPDAVDNLLQAGAQSNDDAAFSIFDRLSRDSYYWSGMPCRALRPVKIANMV